MSSTQASQETEEGHALTRGARRQRAASASAAGDGVGIALDKPIYTLSVASEILDTHPRTLMMYEHLGLITPHRTSTNRRRYSQRDMMKLQAIQVLTREHRVNLAGARLILTMLQTLQQQEMPVPSSLKGLDVRRLRL
jgi:MerR family transcriptional regulator, heat shock protein HspR